MAIVNNFSLSYFFKLIFNLHNKTSALIRQNSTFLYPTIQPNPFKTFNDYLYDTVRYGRLNNPNSLLFGGEIDYLTLSPYDMLVYNLLWRHFNVLNDVEFKKIKTQNPKLNLELGKKFGIIYYIEVLKDRENFEPIANPIIFKYLIDELDVFLNNGLGYDLYERLSLLGIYNYFDDITDYQIHCDILVNNSLTSNLPIYIDLSQYQQLPSVSSIKSINNYLKYINLNGSNSIMKEYYIEKFNKLSDTSEIRQLAFNNFSSFIKFCQFNNFPILYTFPRH